MIEKNWSRKALYNAVIILLTVLVPTEVLVKGINCDDVSIPFWWSEYHDLGQKYGMLFGAGSARDKDREEAAEEAAEKATEDLRSWLCLRIEEVALWYGQDYGRSGQSMNRKALSALVEEIVNDCMEEWRRERGAEFQRCNGEIEVYILGGVETEGLSAEVGDELIEKIGEGSESRDSEHLKKIKGRLLASFGIEKVEEYARSEEGIKKEEVRESASGTEKVRKDNLRVRVETNNGNFTLELYPDKAPVSVENFLQYVENNFYDQTLIHRVVKGFIIQGGGYTVGNIKKQTASPIKNEADNGLKNKKYTISMARTMKVNSATSQFFINLQDNPALDHKGKTPIRYGYAVFGKVVEGQKTIEKIGKVEARKEGPIHKPVKKVIIESMKIIKK